MELWLTSKKISKNTFKSMLHTWTVNVMSSIIQRADAYGHHPVGILIIAIKIPVVVKLRAKQIGVGDCMIYMLLNTFE